MKRIERLLRDTIGLDAATIGSTLIERTVRLRMKHHGLQTTEHYEQLVENSDAEWDQLLEAVVVTETWFFRDRGPFTALGRLVRGQSRLRFYFLPQPVDLLRSADAGDGAGKDKPAAGPAGRDAFRGLSRTAAGAAAGVCLGESSNGIRVRKGGRKFEGFPIGIIA